ncbi:unnamed protein product [Discula destructiva]
MTADLPELPMATHASTCGPIRVVTAEKTYDNANPAPVFNRIWSIATEDENLTMYAFKRFKTSHLVNLRYLEHELDKLDRDVYQAGLSLGHDVSKTGRLLLGHAQKDKVIKTVQDVAQKENIIRLRKLISENDKAMIRFKQLMQMKTFSMFEDDRRTKYHLEMNDWEAYKTSLIRVDLPAGRPRSPFENWLHHFLRWIKWNKRQHDNRAESSQFNSIAFSNIVLNILVATGTITLFVTPTILLSNRAGSPVEIFTISLFIGVFSFIVSFRSGSSAISTMGATAAYGAVLVVFLSNNSVIS